MSPSCTEILTYKVDLCLFEIKMSIQKDPNVLMASIHGNFQRSAVVL